MHLLLSRSTLLRNHLCASLRAAASNAAAPPQAHHHHQRRCLSDKPGPTPPQPPPFKVPVENPISRTLRLLRADGARIKNFILPPTASEADRKAAEADEELTERKMADLQAATTEFQSHCDILIIGGGGVGSSIAYWLKKRAFSGLNVVVLEKDPTVRS